MRKYIALLFFAFYIVVTGCKKPTDSGSPPVVCHPLPECNSPIGPQYITESLEFASLSVNIQNPNQLVMWRTADEKLITYDLLTHTVTELAAVSQMAGTKWHGEWILYNRWVDGMGTGEIYKIRPDGTGRQLLTAGGGRFRPTINSAGNLFLYDATGGPVIMDFDGNFIKKVVPDQNMNIDPWEWFNDSLLLCTGTDYHYMYILNLNSGHLEPVITNPNPDGYSFFGYPVHIDSENIVWTCLSGIKKTNLVTGETTTFFESCSATLYGPMHYYPSTGKLLCDRLSLTNKDNNPCKIVDRSDLITVCSGDAADKVIHLAL